MHTLDHRRCFDSGRGRGTILPIKARAAMPSWPDIIPREQHRCMACTCSPPGKHMALVRRTSCKSIIPTEVHTDQGTGVLQTLTTALGTPAQDSCLCQKQQKGSVTSHSWCGLFGDKQALPQVKATRQSGSTPSKPGGADSLAAQTCTNCLAWDATVSPQLLLCCTAQA